MKNFLAFVLVSLCASVSFLYAQGFTGPGAGTNTGQVQTLTVSQARNLPDHSLVILTGTIVQSLGRERYTFRDASGDITIKIDRELWLLLNLSIGASDRVEIGGKADNEKGVVDIDVKYLKKL